jgi:PAS domain S-box-containing protein
VTFEHNPPPEPVQGVTDATDLDPRLHLAAIVDTSEDPIISEKLDGKILSWNAAAARVFGYRADEIVGFSILKLIPPELHGEEESVLQRVREGKKIEHYETVRIRKNGEVFPISITISPIRDRNGITVAASTIARDISDKKRADESRFRLSAVVDSADDAIISKDLNGIVRTWNKGASRIFGYGAEEMIGQSILKLIPNELRHEEEQILRKLRAGERVEH